MEGEHINKLLFDVNMSANSNGYRLHNIRNGVPLFVVIGNIASGKSTLTENIARLLGQRCCHIPEPVALWRSCGFLQQFYENMQHYALHFQLFAFATRAKLYKDKKWENYDLCIADSHVYTDRYVFTKSLCNRGMIMENEESWYDIMFDSWQSIVPEMSTTMWFYLKTDPATCKERIQTRGRPEESAIAMDYLESLNLLFDQVVEMPFIQRNVKIIEADNDIGAVTDSVEDYVRTYLGEQKDSVYRDSFLSSIPKGDME